MQGADLTQMTDKGAPRVTIVHDPDVRRALLTQKAYAEGLRALYLYTAAHQDVTVADSVSGVDAEMADRVNDLLVPIVKGVGSERAYQRLTESLQTLGGSGFLQDYPTEQYIRDAKIDSPYEGTTAIVLRRKGRRGELFREERIATADRPTAKSSRRSTSPRWICGRRPSNRRPPV